MLVSGRVIIIHFTRGSLENRAKSTVNQCLGKTQSIDEFDMFQEFGVCVFPKIAENHVTIDIQ